VHWQELQNEKAENDVNHTGNNFGQRAGEQVEVSRKQRKDNAGVYGIASDGVRFSFYHMTAGGVVSIIFAEIT
jgi:hypothetical protein